MALGCCRLNSVRVSFILAGMAVPQFRHTMLGVLRREATFQGKPTSYWVYAAQCSRGQAEEQLRKGRLEALPVVEEMLLRDDGFLVAYYLIEGMNPEERQKAIPTLINAYVHYG